MRKGEGADGEEIKTNSRSLTYVYVKLSAQLAAPSRHASQEDVFFLKDTIDIFPHFRNSLKKNPQLSSILVYVILSSNDR